FTAPQLCGDLGVGVLLQPKPSNEPQLLVRQALQQGLKLLGHQHRKIGSRFAADDLVQIGLRCPGASGSGWGRVDTAFFGPLSASPKLPIQVVPEWPVDTFPSLGDSRGGFVWPRSWLLWPPRAPPSNTKPPGGKKSENAVGLAVALARHSWEGQASLPGGGG